MLIGVESPLLSLSAFFSPFSFPEFDFPAAAACIARNLSIKLPSLEKNSGLGVAFFSFSASLAAFDFFIHDGIPGFFAGVELWGMAG